MAEQLPEGFIPSQPKEVNLVLRGKSTALPDGFIPSYSPDEVKSKIKEHSIKYGLPPEIALGVAEQESRFNTAAINPVSNATGAFQFIPSTSKSRGFDASIPDINIEEGVKYLKELHDRFGGDTERALKAYGGVVDDTKYVPEVMQRISKYKTIPDGFVPDLQEEPTIEEPTLESEPVKKPYGIGDYAAMATRGLSGFAPGGFVGAGIGGVGELAAEFMEGRPEINWAQVATQAGLGAIPFGKAATLLRGAAKGATMGAGSTIATQQAEQGLHIPDAEDVSGLVLPTVISAVSGGTAGALTRRQGRLAHANAVSEIIPEAAPIVAPRPTEQLELPISDPTIPEPIQRLKEAVDKAVELAKEQARSYTVERNERVAKARAVKTTGIAGFYEQLGHLKGQYEKLNMPPLRELVSKENIDDIVDIISNAGIRDEFTKIHAKSGFVKLLNGDVPQPSELKILNAILGTTIEIPGRPQIIKVPSRTRQIYELTRAMQTVDVPFMTSAAFRQGAPLAGTRAWFNAYKTSIKSFRSEKVYDKIMEGLEQKLIHRERTIMDEDGVTQLKSIAQEIGLASSDLKTLSKREEQLKGILAEKLPFIGPLIRGNNRSFTAFINTLRTDTAEKWLRAANLIDDKDMITNLVEAKKIANTINELTGHGSLKIAAPFSRFTKSGREADLERAADTLSMIFYSPRLLARDARMMNPLNYMKNDKLVRMEYLKGAVRRAGVWAGFTTLGAITGAQVIDNPLSSDFGKIKYKDTRVDAGAGLLQWVTLAARQIAGASTSSTSGKTTEFGSTPMVNTRGGAIAEFAKNRLHPSLAPILSFINASKSAPFYPLSEMGEAITPFPVNDLYELMKSDPEIAEIIAGLAATPLSMGSQTYGRKDFGKPLYGGTNQPKFKGGKPF